MADYVIQPITNEDLTTKVVDGTGIFDELMTAANAHLTYQWEQDRITGTSYAEVYLGQLTAVLGQAVLFLTERDKTYLNNLLVQSQIKLADAQVALAAQDLLNKQQELLNAQKQMELMEQQIQLAEKQVELADKELLVKDKEMQLLDKQIAVQEATADLTRQKIKTEMAQISDSVDGVSVTGILGAQIALYKQQRDGFLRDAEQKALKIVADTWITRKTVDDGTPLPTGFDTAAVDAFTRKVADGVQVNY
ncbi:hypothetical protein Pylas_069 [Klebsiella phage Pylas]|uniref:Uncharacterized protein n=1 Tax=Klebsiella phage Pylas TaxID=2419682 RepID=A0A3G3BYF9_9CAUD|nr:virion structural protein [Klebsiella phage Pylas]AYP69323.1 hypothetical protein Pylas_069 [Klebsiella phage Pylas]